MHKCSPRERERDNRIKVYIYDAPARFARIGAEYFVHTHTLAQSMCVCVYGGEGTNTSAVKHSPDGSAQRLTEQPEEQWDSGTDRRTGSCLRIEAKLPWLVLGSNAACRGVAKGGGKWKTKRRENPFAHKMRHSVHYFNVTDKSFLCRC